MNQVTQLITVNQVTQLITVNQVTQLITVNQAEKPRQVMIKAVGKTFQNLLKKFG